MKHARLAAEAVHRKEVPLEEIADVLRDNAQRQFGRLDSEPGWLRSTL